MTAVNVFPFFLAPVKTINHTLDAAGTGRSPGTGWTLWRGSPSKCFFLLILSWRQIDLRRSQNACNCVTSHLLFNTVRAAPFSVSSPNCQSEDWPKFRGRKLLKIKAPTMYIHAKLVFGKLASPLCVGQVCQSCAKLLGDHGRRPSARSSLCEVPLNEQRQRMLPMLHPESVSEFKVPSDKPD